MANFDNGEKSIAQIHAKGAVKWFNAIKGYGFVTLENGGDAFCHASALAATGHADLPQGATIVCDLADSQRGLQVVTIHSIDTSTADQMAPRKPRRNFDDGGDRFGSRGGYESDRFDGDRFGGGRFGGHRDSGPNGARVEGKIKFFNVQKGFGFVMPDSGSGDIYMHASALRRSGVQVVESEQRIRYSTRQGTKGVEVDRIELI